MKIQIESVEYVESLFKELQEETGIEEKDEKEVLSQIKSLFLKNVEVGKDHQEYVLSPEEAEKQKEQIRLVSQIEEAESVRMAQIKHLCALRKTLPEQLRREVSGEHEDILKRIRDPLKRADKSINVSSGEEAKEVSKAIKELTESFPALLTNIKKNVNYVEQELKEKKKKIGKQIEAQTLSLLFKDELEIQ
ncbi:hypothetical protein NEFER03_1259 [Nematocida sp. LUAm3]|nr:hypothetical protein NEFER03_1259 [Nematocida sp. LUAm3]KAI5174119.1 hypothetical protein NEFER02_0586 [Nematocida sp. LUAm2]KAI5177138.1 hypothetical protein NEFER01_0413 [Nematocida sp. LUAm1]